MLREDAEAGKKKGRHSHAGLEEKLSLEAEAEAELARERARNVGRRGADEPGRRLESTWVIHIWVEVVAIIRTIRQVESLSHDLHVGFLADLDVLRQPGIKLEERIAAK